MVEYRKQLAKELHKPVRKVKNTLKVVVPSKITVEPVVVNVSALVKFMPEPAKLRVCEPRSKAAVPPVVLKAKEPLKSAVSAKVTLPLAVAVPIVTLLKNLLAEVNVVVPSKIKVEPVVVNVSAFVKFNVAPA